MQVVEVVEPALLPTHPAYLSQKYFRSLDVFRFLAILGVIWHHTTHEPFPSFPAALRGFLGVDFFFVISGFLIVTLLLRERDRNGSISLRQFYLRRTLRIFPIYYGLLAALTVFFLFVKPQSSMAKPFFETWLSQAFYFSNFVAATSKTILFFTWSLAAEEQFYLVWPPVEKWLGKLAIPILFVVIVVNQLINFGLLNGVIGESAKQLNIFQITFTPICLGVLLAHVLHDPRGFGLIARWLGSPWMSIILLALMILACNIPNPELMGWPRLSIQVSMTLLLASCVIREDNWLNQALGFVWIRRVGVISYGMYLYHEFAAHAANVVLRVGKITLPFSFFFLTLLLSIAAAELSYRFYETPFLKLKDRLAHASRKREAAISP